MLAPISSAPVCAPTQASLKRQPSRSSVRSQSSALRLKVFTGELTQSEPERSLCGLSSRVAFPNAGPVGDHVVVAEVRVRQAVNADESALGDLFRRASLSNAGDRA